MDDRQKEYFTHTSAGCIKLLDDWWAILACDKGVVDLRVWLAKRYGKSFFSKGSRYGPHITLVKGEEPTIEGVWKELSGRVCEFNYTPTWRDNGYYAWLDCHCPELDDVRAELGLEIKPNFSFHLTLGRLL